MRGKGDKDFMVVFFIVQIYNDRKEDIRYCWDFIKKQQQLQKKWRYHYCCFAPFYQVPDVSMDKTGENFPYPSNGRRGWLCRSEPEREKGAKERKEIESMDINRMFIKQSK
jgi:hypothetical protein